LLLGLVREGQGAAIQVLTRLGVAPDALRTTVLQLKAAAAASPDQDTEDAAGDGGEESQLDRIETTLQQILERQDVLVRLIRQLDARLPPSTE
jgi:hypothetical protein